jgi:anti-sigma regulatory factor (Ser/Thr protein kinase)
MEACLKFLLPSEPRFLSVVRAAVGELGSVYGWPDDACRGIILAIDEAVANIIRHAYRGAPDQPVEVNCEGFPDRVEFALIDRGEPPDPARICAQPLDDTALDGRGTHIIRLIMDEVRYERVPGGNRLWLSKRMPATARIVNEKGNEL